MSLQLTPERAERKYSDTCTEGRPQDVDQVGSGTMYGYGHVLTSLLPSTDKAVSNRDHRAGGRSTCFGTRFARRFTHESRSREKGRSNGGSERRHVLGEPSGILCDRFSYH
jgi:hypothetical protein